MALSNLAWQSRNVLVDFNYEGVSYNLGTASVAAIGSSESQTGKFDKSGLGNGIIEVTGSENSDTIDLTFHYLTYEHADILQLAYDEKGEATLTLSLKSDPSKQKVLNPCGLGDKLFQAEISDTVDDKILIPFFGKFSRLDEGTGAAN